MAQHQINTTGVLTKAGDVAGVASFRLEIHDLIKNDKQFSLYIQALTEFQKLDQAELLSYFQIAGIHGLPFESWDNSQGIAGAQAGYCTHSSVLFPTWHRPYLALYEQALQSQAQAVATKYTTDTDAWKAAADTLRLPYWDWARFDIPPDEVIRKQTVTITTPQGKQSVTNPLYQYTFHPIDDSFQPPYSDLDNTVRWPDPNSPNDSQPDQLVQALQGPRGRTASALTKATYTMLTTVKKWDQFSNDSASQTSATANSLETLHDWIHGRLGGDGHMGFVPYAAFDPIFWLHHTNVDRLAALWQAINPTVWVTPRQEIATFNLRRGTRDTNTDLAPFWNGPSTFWTSSSDATRAWTGFNYNYPEFKGLENQSQSTVRSRILAQVEVLYNARTRSISALQAPIRLAAMAMPSTARAASPARAPSPPSSTEDEPAPTPAHNPDEHGQYTSWFVRIRAKRYELGTSYTVFLFIGEPPASPSEWHTAENQIGAHFQFVNTTPERCANCVDNRELVTEGFVDITDELDERNKHHLPEEEIEAYLKENLHWRLAKADGTEVPLSSLPSLEVSVMTTPMTFSRADQVFIPPANSTPVHRGVTAGREGGRG